jgi:DNA-binding winged helix-turn-helix (wHTH) protein
LDIRLLGSLEVGDDLGRPVAVRGSRLTTLLIALALRCGEVVSDDRLSEILWGDHPPHGANALQRRISTLRGVLGRADAIERKGRGYALSVEREAIDVFRFEGLGALGHEAIRVGDVARASALFDEGRDLWRGDALVDVADELFAQADRTRLTEMKVATVEARIDADLALGRHAALVPRTWTSSCSSIRCESTCGPSSCGLWLGLGVRRKHCGPTGRPVRCWVTSSVWNLRPSCVALRWRSFVKTKRRFDGTPGRLLHRLAPIFGRH